MSISPDSGKDHLPDEALPDDAEQPDSRIARILAQYMEIVADEDEIALDEFLRSHAELKPELVDMLQTLESIRNLSEGVEIPRQFGDFQILDEAGRGGMGIVYEAIQLSLDRHVALKILPAGCLTSAKSVARFYREAKVAASVHHPNIVEVHALGVEAGVPYFAMEFVKGLTLQQLLQRLRPSPGNGLGTSTSEAETIQGCDTTGGPPDWEPPLEKSRDDEFQTRLPTGVLDILLTSAATHRGGPVRVQSMDSAYYPWLAEAFAGAAEGLQEAHHHGIVHRDVKPSNLILDTDGRLRILDFGLAHVEGQQGLTLTRERLGTPMYMSPEQASGSSRNLGAGTDIYSLGATLYEMLVWRPPSSGQSSMETLHNIVQRDPVPPRKLNARVPKDLETVVLQCLQKKPEHRYATAEALAQDLRRIVRGDPIEARPSPWYERLSRRAWRSRRKLLEAAGAVALFLCLTVAVLAHNHSVQQQRKAERDDKALEAVKHLLTVDLRSAWTRLDRAQPQRFDLILLEEGPVFETRNAGGTGALFEAGPELVDVWPDNEDADREQVLRAVATLGKATEATGGSATLEFLLARAHFGTDSEEEATRHLSASLEAAPEFLPALTLARILEEEGRFTLSGEQRNRLSRLTATAGSWEEAWFRARHAVHQRRWEDAAAAYDDLLAAEKTQGWPYPGSNLEALAWSGIAYFRAGRRERFAGAFNSLHTLWPEAVEPVLMLAKAACLNDSWPYVEELFRALYRRTPESRKDSVARAMAGVYREVGNFQRARLWTEGIRDQRLRLLMMSSLLNLLGNAPAAYEEAQVFAARYPDDVLTRLLVGNALMGQKRFREAGRQFEQAVERYPEDPRPLVNLGVSLEARGELTEAAKCFWKALELDTTMSQEHYKQAFILSRRGRMQEAMDHYREAVKCFWKALELDTTMSQAHYNLAFILSRRGRMQEAMDHYQQAVVVDANNSLAHNNLGTLLDRAEHLEEARLQYKAATRLASGLGLAHYNLGWAYHRQRRFVDASEAFQKAISLGLSQEAIVHENLAPGLQAQNRLDEAVYEYQIALRLNENNARTHQNLATALHRQGKLEEAILHYNRAIELEPQWKNAHNALGYAYRKKEEHDKAIVEFRTAIELDPDFVHAHNDLAVVMLESGMERPRGDELKAEVSRLEDAALLPGASPAISCLLEEYRKALAPDIASYTSMDAVLDSLEELIPQEASWQYYIGEVPPSTDLEWTRESFDDSGWMPGTGGIDLRGTDPTTTAGADLKSRSACLRHRFEVSDPERIKRLRLAVKLSGGLVAYLNGVEVGRLRAKAPHSPVPFDAEAEKGEYFWNTARVIWMDAGNLEPGTNVLVIHGLPSPTGKPELHLLPVLSAEVSFDARSRERARKAFEAYTTHTSDPETRNQRLYFEGGRLQREGDYGEAAARYREILSSGETRYEPFLRLAECLRKSGHAGEAERTLHEGLTLNLSRYSVLWDAWLETTMVDLNWPAQTILSALPSGLERTSDQIDDICWLLEQLRDARDIRINCGGREYDNLKGHHWSRDRFFLGGWPEVLAGLGDPGVNLEDPPLYETERFFFQPLRVRPGYRIPLPQGSYRVTLLFVEGWFKTPGSRRFDVFLEDHRYVEDYEPLAPGYGVPDRREYTVTVDDGALNIDFGRLVENPKISAFSIQRLPY